MKGWTDKVKCSYSRRKKYTEMRRRSSTWLLFRFTGNRNVIEPSFPLPSTRFVWAPVSNDRPATNIYGTKDFRKNLTMRKCKTIAYDMLYATSRRNNYKRLKVVDKLIVFIPTWKSRMSLLKFRLIFYLLIFLLLCSFYIILLYKLFFLCLFFGEYLHREKTYLH